MSDPASTDAQPSASAVSSRRRTWGLLALPLVALAAIWVGTATPYFGGETWAGFDLREQVLPWRVFMAWCLERGELGLWNPFLARGYDHLAEGQAGILHPAHWLIYGLLDLRLAVALELLLPMPVAVVGGYLLMRRGLRVGPLAAIAAAALMGANVFYFAHFMHVNMAWVAAHLPWLLWAATAVLRGRNRLATAAFALLMASMWLLGHPQQVWLNGLAVGIYIAAWGAHARWGATWRRGLGWLIVAVALGTAIGMLQILPTMAGLADSERGSISQADRENFALHPLNAVIQVAPYFFTTRILPVPTTEGGKPPRMINSYQEFPAYLGVGFLTLLVMLALGPGGAWRDASWRRAAIVGLAGAGLLVLLAMGPWGGLQWLTSRLPIIGAFRAPSRHILPLFALLGVALGLLWQRCADAPATARDVAGERRMLGGLAALQVLWVIAACAQILLLRRGGLAIFDTRLSVEGSWAYLLAPGATVVLVGLALWGWRRTGRSVFAVAAVTVCIIDVGAYALPVLRGVERPEPRMPLARLEQAREVMDPTAEYRHLAGLNEPVLDGYLMANGYLGLPPADKLVLEPVGDPNIWPRHVRLASVTTIHTREGTRAFQGLPRARLVPVLRASMTPLADLVNTPLTDVALSHTTWPECWGLDEPTPLIGPTEYVSIEAASSSMIRLRVGAAVPRLLVLSDRYHPGWSVRVDDREDDIAPLYDRMLMGVYIPAGSHDVVLTYQSRQLRWGAYCAVPGLLGILALILLHFRRRTPATDA